MEHEHENYILLRIKFFLADHLLQSDNLESQSAYIFPNNSPIFVRGGGMVAFPPPCSQGGFDDVKDRAAPFLACVDYIACFKPTVFIIENVAGASVYHVSLHVPPQLPPPGKLPPLWEVVGGG